MFITVFHLCDDKPPQFIGPFDTYREAERFRDSWDHRENVKEVDIVRVDKPLTPDQCVLPLRWEKLMGPRRSELKAVS